VCELKERLKAELDIDWDQNHNRFCCVNHILNLAAQAALVHLKDDISKVNYCFSIALHCPFSNCYFFSHFKASRSPYFYSFLASAVWISYTSLSRMQYWQYQIYPWLHYPVELNLWYDQDWTTPQTCMIFFYLCISRTSSLIPNFRHWSPSQALLMTFTTLVFPIYSGSLLRLLQIYFNHSRISPWRCPQAQITQHLTLFLFSILLLTTLMTIVQAEEMDLVGYFCEFEQLPNLQEKRWCNIIPRQIQWQCCAQH